MQLFTIGLVKLNLDGTQVLDRWGSPSPTYESKDVVSFGRAWTGFTYAPMRGNAEDTALSSNGRIDPMVIGDAGLRDWWPKRGLERTYIGDRYPLCVSFAHSCLIISFYSLINQDHRCRLIFHYYFISIRWIFLNALSSRRELSTDFWEDQVIQSCRLMM